MTEPSLASRRLDELTIDDEPSFRHVALYTDLKTVLQRANVAFRVLPPSPRGERGDHALFLNLTFWSSELGGEILASDRVPADVVAHAAWHHLANNALVLPGEKPSVEALFLGESIASAFDVYLVGRLLGHAPSSTFLESQVPAMFDVAEAAGLSETEFERLLEHLAKDPEQAFADLRALLFDAASALFACHSVDEAFAALTALEAGERSRSLFALLHRYELSNWVLYARTFGRDEPDERVREVDRTLRSRHAIDWLERTWVRPTLRP